MQEARLASTFLVAEGKFDGKLRDFFFARASRPDSSSSAVSSEVALRYLKKSLPHAVAIAGNSTIDPDVLSRFAKDPRVSVRHEAIVNPSLPTDALLYLLKWLFRHDSSDPMPHSAQIWRLSAAQLQELSEDIVSHRKSHRSGVRISDDNLRRIALTLSSSREHFAAVRTEAFLNLDVKLAQLALSGSLHDVTLAEVFTKVSADFSGEDHQVARALDLLRELLEGGGMLTNELLDLWDGVQAVRQSYYRTIGPAVLVEEGVLSRLASGPPQYLELAVLNRAPEKLVASRIPQADVSVLGALTSMLGTGYLSPASERLMAERVLQLLETPAAKASSGHELVAAIVLRSESVLPEHLLIQLLRKGGAGLTTGWLNPSVSRHRIPGGAIIEFKCQQPVTAEVLSSLASDPGLALDRSRLGYRSSIQGEGSWEGIMTELLAASEGSAEVGKVVVDILGDNLTGRHLTSGTSALRLYPYIRSVIGEDLDVWATFMKLACDWEGGVGDLLEASKLLVHS